MWRSLLCRYDIPAFRMQKQRLISEVQEIHGLSITKLWKWITTKQNTTFRYEINFFSVEQWNIYGKTQNIFFCCIIMKQIKSILYISEMSISLKSSEFLVWIFICSKIKKTYSNSINIKESYSVFLKYYIL
jgi:hypothetical protein